MKNLFNRLNNRQKKSAKIIAAMLIVAVVLFAVLNVLPKPKTGTTGTEVQNNTNSEVTNTPSTNTTPSQPEPQPIYQTIHYDEVGHWETQVIQEAYDIPVYERKIIGNQTGTIYSSVDEFAFNTNGDGSYHVGDVQVGTTHHDAVTQQVWVVDQAARDETVIVGYR